MRVRQLCKVNIKFRMVTLDGTIAETEDLTPVVPIVPKVRSFVRARIGWFETGMQAPGCSFEEAEQEVRPGQSAQAGARKYLALFKIRVSKRLEQQRAGGLPASQKLKRIQELLEALKSGRQQMRPSLSKRAGSPPSN